MSQADCGAMISSAISNQTAWIRAVQPDAHIISYLWDELLGLWKSGCVRVTCLIPLVAQCHHTACSFSYICLVLRLFSRCSRQSCASLMLIHHPLHRQSMQTHVIPHCAPLCAMRHERSSCCMRHWSIIDTPALMGCCAAGGDQVPHSTQGRQRDFYRSGQGQNRWA